MLRQKKSLASALNFFFKNNTSTSSDENWRMAPTV
jgi:hypothetical protein